MFCRMADDKMKTSCCALFPVQKSASSIAIRRQTRPSDSDTSARWRRSRFLNCENKAINTHIFILSSSHAKNPPAFSKSYSKNFTAQTKIPAVFLRQCQGDGKPKSPDICEKPSCRRWCGCRHVHRSSPKGAFAHAQRKASPPK